MCDNLEIKAFPRYFHTMPSYSAHDVQLIKELQRLRKVFVARPEDDEWLLKITPRPDLLVSQATKRGSLLSLGGGRYIPRSIGVDGLEAAPDYFPLPLIVAARLFPQPAALAYRSALIHHGLLADRGEQRTVFAVRGLEGVRLSKLAGKSVRLVRVDHERFFGHEPVRFRDEGWLRLNGTYQVTDLERTLVDLLDKPRLSGSPEVVAKAFARGFQKGANGQRVAQYAMDLGHSVARRAAFWLGQVGEESAAKAIMVQEHIHEEALADRHRLPGRVARGRPRASERPLLHPVLLDSTKTHAATGVADTRYGLVVNLPARIVKLAAA